MKVHNTDRTDNNLREARQRIDKIMNRQREPEFAFNERLEDAKEELRKQNEVATKKVRESYKQGCDSLYYYRNSIGSGGYSGYTPSF